MSFWNNMSFGEKLLGIAALGTGVGELATGGALFAGMGADTALGGIGGAIDSGASAIGSGASSLGSGIANLFGSSAPAAGGASTTAGAAGSMVNPETVGDAAINSGAGAGAGAANPPANVPSGMLSRLATNLTTPARGSTGTLGTGAGYGFAGQLGIGALGLEAINLANKKANYGTPGIQPYTGVGSNLTGAQGVQYLRGMAVGGMVNTPNVPMSHNVTPAYATAQNTPMPQPVMTSADPMSALGYVGNQGQQLSMPFAEGGMASGGISNLGHYSDGGQMLKGPGDGMSDSIPATIANKQPARLANDEFVVPADVVSHLGNGSSDAGAKKLYEMMDRVRRVRTGTPKQAKAIHPDRYMPG